MIEIELSWTEKMMAVIAGAHKHLESKARGRKDNHGYDARDEWDVAIEGAMGEMAAGKALGLYWDGAVNKFTEGGDLGRLIQVRTTKRHTNGLLIRPGDPDEKPFVHVSGKNGEYRVHGWAFGREAKQACWIFKKPPRPDCFFMPTEEVHDLASLPGSILMLVGEDPKQEIF